MGLEDVIHARGDLELAILPAELLSGRRGLLRAEGSAVGIVAVGLVGRAIADNGLHLDERGLVRARLGLCNRLADGIHVRVAILHRQHLPAVGLVALAHILREGKLRVAVDGDAVVIPEGDQLAQAKVPGICARLVGDALLQAAIAHDAVGVVVDEGKAWLVVHRRLVSLGRRQADGIGDAHAERPRGDLDALGLKVLGVPRRLGAPLPELLDVVNGHARVAGEVEQRVLQHAAMA
mmetsp:Transcript_118787/g.298772  ORF Transcript_118787/g.298772 Transcript_118787/m.298772 type:complete len:236 (+) Transcript_118787:1191-1898(+)